MTRDELMIETLNETLSNVISENLNLVVSVKEIKRILNDTQKEAERMAKQYRKYQTETDERVTQLQKLVLEKTKGN